MHIWKKCSTFGANLNKFENINIYPNGDNNKAKRCNYTRKGAIRDNNINDIYFAMKFYASYSRYDTQRVQEVCRQFERSGISIDFEEGVIDSGEKQTLSLINHIASSDAILLFYSQYTEQSAWVKREIEYAQSKGKRIISILLSECPNDSWFNKIVNEYEFVPLYKGKEYLKTYLYSSNSEPLKGDLAPNPSLPKNWDLINMYM